KNAVPATIATPPARERDVYLQAIEDAQKRARTYGKDRDIKNLQAAGYSMDQIDQLQTRAEELAAQFRRLNADQIGRGLGSIDPVKYAGLSSDPYFALKDEIGDVEYERFLTAIKRRT